VITGSQRCLTISHTIGKKLNIRLKIHRFPGTKEIGGPKNYIHRISMSSIDFIVGDACSLELNNNSIDLIVTAPPYSGVDSSRYGGDRKKQINDNSKRMLRLLLKSTKEMERVIKPSGSIFIDIGHANNMPYFYVSEVLKSTNLKLVSPPFIWDYSDTIYTDNKETLGSLGQNYGFWFHFSKQPESIYYNPFLGKKYKFPIWKVDWNEDNDVIKESSKHGFILDSFNSEIPKRFIEMFTKPNATVLDPFGGSGVTAIQAYKSGRNGISVDISEDQTKLAKKRFKIEIEHGG
jgi:site-specific DNA-methyltransferase (adenine-specific)